MSRESAVREEGAELEAGWAINLLVYESVMGWAISDFQRTGLAPEMMAKGVNHNQAHPFWWCEDFSRSIVAAWVVVEKLAPKYKVTIATLNDGRWAVRFGRYLHGNDAHHGEAETAPLAICRAALKTTPTPTTAAP